MFDDNVCNYIYEIKHDLDNNYMNNITLKQRIKYHVEVSSCREFKRNFIFHH